MAGVSVESGKGGRKQLDSEINMIPMIDLLMVTISFLLITAVWTHMARVESSAQVPGSPEPCLADCDKPDRKLHVAMDATKFTLTWKDNGKVVRSSEVPRQSRATVDNGHRTLRFPELSERVAAEWRELGQHRDATDKALDKVVVHTPNDAPYTEVVAMIDAVSAPQRPLGSQKVSALTVTFAAD
jgi:biopolymer transport protein ExbD